MKKLFNTRERMVDDMIDGFIAAYPGVVSRGVNPRVVRRTVLRTREDKVALLIGNGSGHEPIAMGFVGTGLLDANIVGDVFTAPSADLILEGIEEVAGSSGAVLLISRHEGDVINGRSAAALARDDGLNVRALLMYDDISSAPRGQESERRGAAGTMFIYKILGAAAEENRSLDALIELGEQVRASTRTLGAAVQPGVSPVTGELMFTLAEDEIYIGMGVHGEPGVSRRKVGPVSELVQYMIEQLLDDRPIAPGTDSVVLVNGSGGTTMMELLTVYAEVARQLGKRDIPSRAPMIGSYSTTQEMGGFSISLLTPTADMLRLWTAPHEAPCFPRIVDVTHA
jgi:dihydroxyacetone kinase-like protein